ncbi:MAG: NADP-dependent phosphogluconate dehydrogenase [Pseudomonadota bacterium]
MQIGLIGLGVMGRNLALNMRDAGFELIATDAWESARAWRADNVRVVESAAELVGALEAPRLILMMIKAGEPVDAQLRELQPLLSAGDTVIDGGNSLYKDTNRRDSTYGEEGLGFLGLGVSGGAEGARNGPAMMAGGPEAGWKHAEPVLSRLAARANGRPCVAWFGAGGAGHFVKMVHNGIEYAVMQAIAETFALLRGPGGLAHADIGRLLEKLSEGPLGGYLLEISAEILQTVDPDTGAPIVDVIDDKAGQKGTGAWCAAAGLEYGVPVPAIAAAVGARQVSGATVLRREAVRTFTGDREAGANGDLAKMAEAALGGSIICALSQGLHLIAKASDQNGWRSNLADAAHVWRAGSIMRMKLLEEAIEAFSASSPVANLVAAPPVANMLSSYLLDWRNAVAEASQAGVPVPVMMATLAWFDGIRTERLPTALVQAQRDRFGRHGFARTDKDGQHHGPWAD